MRRLETTQPDKVRLLWPHMPALSGGKVVGNDGNRGGSEAGRGSVPGRGGVNSIGGKNISSANKTLFHKKIFAAVYARLIKDNFSLLRMILIIKINFFISIRDLLHLVFCESMPDFVSIC